ncbi:unnamed protein product [Acanthoscelides obtectus]|uniref:Uncharacterized protein n=1 Tax=Acanthoscelides obtectus TaxID=200917 RepID=A0A9P0KA50_ACAOB|nr:unnamed protein product [Acanthoscelides obtectus]CAK1632385.1 hypothetical protein AOBTE_LOCUS7524 [Acanthoscelides obtectus]
MSKKSGAQKNKSTEVLDDFSGNMDSELNSVLSQLAAGMIGLQKSFEGLSMIVKGGSDKKDVCSESKAPDHNFIYIWNELGGNDVVFSPEGRKHPQAYIKKLKKLFLDAGVPDSHKIGLAVSCLRGTAVDWAAMKEDTWL